MIDAHLYAGRFLIALPELSQDFFSTTVTLLVEHSSDGAFGLVINRPTNATLSQLLPDVASSAANLPVLIGGPVEQDHLYFLHSSDRQYAQSKRINDDISLTTSSELVDDLSCGTSPEHTLALLGYAGWSPSQLEQELVSDVWLVAPFDRDIVFSTPYADRPFAAAQKMGIDLNLIRSDPTRH